jgi:hypothetical protein
MTHLEQIAQFKNNIQAWMNYWLDNTVYGILSREIYKMSSRSRLSQYPKNLSTLNYERRRNQMNNNLGNSIVYNQFWGGNNLYKTHNLFEHFQYSEYDNLLGAKVDDILGSFTRANFQPMLDIPENHPMLPLASQILNDLENFFEKNIENKHSLIQCFDNQISCGYSALKMQIKFYDSKQEAKKEIPKYKIFLENCPYPELCFFNPYSLSPTKTDSYYDDPLSFAGQCIKMPKNTLKTLYPKVFKNEDPLSLGFEWNRNTPLYNYIPDRRKDLVLCAEYYDYVDGKCRYTFFCANKIIEQEIIDIDFLPMIFVAGNTSYVNNIQEVYSIFDKFLPIQKAINHINQLLLENSFFCKTTTIFFTNTATTDDLYKTTIENFTKYNVLMLPMTSKGAEEQIPPMSIPAVDLPVTLINFRREYLLYLEESLRGSFDHNESGFGQSARALQIKQVNRNNLFARQLGNLTIALSKVCDFYKKMHYIVEKINASFDSGNNQENIITSFSSFDEYKQIVELFNFSVLIDPDRSVTQEANQQWIANAMPLVQSNPILAEEMFYLLLNESDLPNKEKFKKEIRDRLEQERQRQEQMAKEPTPIEKIQAQEIQADLELQSNKIEADLHKQTMKDSTALLTTIWKGEYDNQIASKKIDVQKLQKTALSEKK